MISKWTLLFLVVICQLYPDNPLIPSTPVNLTNDGSCNTSTAVAAASAGFMVVFIETSTSNIESVFSSDGQTWQSPIVSSSTNGFGNPLAAGNQDGFLATIVAPTIGIATGAAYSLFSANETTWAFPELIEASSSIQFPIGVAGTTSGFLTVWVDTSDDNIYASFSDNDGSSWSSAVQVTSTGTAERSPIVAAQGTNFLVTWGDSSANAYASFSSDNGMNWTTPVEFVTDNSVASGVWVGANSSGFMATWQDEGGNALSSFSSDNGATWSTPVQITSDLTGITDVTVTGCSAGFIVAWIGSDSNVYGSLSSDDGSTWSTPVQITDDGRVNTSSQGYAPFIGLAAFSNTCVFAWEDQNNNAISSFVTFSSELGQPTNLSGVQTKNNFGLIYELFNQLQWDGASGAVGYNIYRNGNKIATLNAATLIYQDHNQSGAVVTYGVSAFDANGNESSVTTTTVH